ncbi:MAG: hypothetical protein M3P01_10240 [Actinomycetota bacterium]|nr:hypothetical protein [Actinomycetota bacterium]
MKDERPRTIQVIRHEGGSRNGIVEHPDIRHVHPVGDQAFEEQPAERVRTNCRHEGNLASSKSGSVRADGGSPAGPGTQERPRLTQAEPAFGPDELDE